MPSLLVVAVNHLSSTVFGSRLIHILAVLISALWQGLLVVATLLSLDRLAHLEHFSLRLYTLEVLQMLLSILLLDILSIDL